MRSETDKILLRKARDFDEETLAKIYDHYSGPLYRYAMRLLSDRDLAEECVAETFSRFLNALKNGAGPEDQLQAYLYRIAHNWITDIYRKHAPLFLPISEDVPDPGREPSQVFSESMDRQKVRAALVSLTPDQRQVIMLKFVEDWNNHEIARAMGKPVGAIKALQHRALVALRQVLSVKD